MSAIAAMPRAFGAPLSEVILRQTPADFQVDEQIGFEPEGSGEHVFVHIRKQGVNTQWLAAELARWAGIKRRDVSYAGLKDRHAITTQWFSLYMPGTAELPWSEMAIEGVEVIAVTRHQKKLRPGMLKNNQFRITLHNVNTTDDLLQQRLSSIKQRGVPNYFGEQRFGRDGGNLDNALAIFSGKRRVRDRGKQGILISAARSHLFNMVLAERVRQDNWYKAIDGDCMVLDGSHSFFCIDAVDDEIERRLDEFDIHPGGPRWGRGECPTKLQSLELEQQVLEDVEDFRSGLESLKLKMERRAMRMLPVGIESEWLDQQTLVLSFSLSAGQYATSFLHELFSWDSSRGNQ